MLLCGVSDNGESIAIDIGTGNRIYKQDTKDVHVRFIVIMIGRQSCIC